MTEGTPIGTGRYRLLSTLPTTLPRIVRHLGYDTILDRDVTILALTAATPHRDEVLEAATRAVLVEDERMQRVHDVETSSDAFIVTEPTEGVPFSTFARADSDPALIRAIIGEVAQVLDACSRRGLHHLHLSPDSVRLRPDGRVRYVGCGLNIHIKRSLLRASISLISRVFCPLYVSWSELTPHTSILNLFPIYAARYK